MSGVPEYRRRLLAAFEAGHIQAGDAVDVTVEHAPKCSFSKSGTCNCAPLVQILYPSEVLTIGADGHVLERRKRT